MNQTRIFKKIRNEPSKNVSELNQTRIFKKVRNESNKDVWEINQYLKNELNKDV